MTGEVQLRERLSKDPAQAIVRHVAGPKIRQEFETLFAPQLEIHLAHTLMLADTGIIPQDAARSIVSAVLALAEAGSDAIRRDDTLEDLYSHVEQHLVRQLGAEIAGRMHTARSRNDLGVTVWRMAHRERLLAVIDATLRLRAVLLSIAEQRRTTVMPGYTHSQHAQPMTLGYYMVAFADVLERDTARLLAAYSRMNCNPLGAAALTTTGFPIDREATTRRLGFSELVENGFDAVASRDDAEEAACAIALLGLHLGRVAEDLFVWHTAEFALIEFSDDFASVSSIMPQKKNPGLLEFIKKQAGHLIGGAMQVLAATKGSWFTDASDATDAANEPLIDGCEKAVACLEVLSGALDSMTVREDRMLHLARIGYGTMTEVADTIVRESGVSFRVAHNIVGKTVAEAIERGLAADELTHEMFEHTSQALMGMTLGVTPKAINEALDPVGNIRRRTVRGGVAPEEVSRMLAVRSARLSEDQARLAAEQSRLTSSREALFDESRAFVAT